MSSRKQIYMAIAERMSDAVPEIKHIALWNEQVENIAGDIVWPRPALFIEFETIEWRQQGNRVRRGDVAVRLHIITDSISYNGHTDTEREDAALAYFDLIDKINNAMQGFKGNNFAGFMLTSSATNHNHAELLESVERYITSAQDISAVDTNSVIHPISAVNITNNPAE